MQNRSGPPRAVISLLAATAVGATLLLGPGGASAQGKTQKLSKAMLERAQDTQKAIQQTEKQLDKVTDRYGRLIGGKDQKARRKEHKKVADELGKLEKRAKDVRKRSQAMEREASKYFKEWGKSIDGIKDNELRSLSRQRLTESQQGYGRTVAAGREAADQYDTFVSMLGNQLKYLEVDLSDPAVAKLKSSNQDLRGEAKELRSRIAKLKSEIDSHLKGLK
jgi:ElaB/YqjD/DUF883 family membrane-anchored ribosome-binding protein